MSKTSKTNQRLKRATELSYYPLALNIKNKLAIVAGGGKVALMKVKALDKAKAKVKIVAPELIPELLKLKKKLRLEWIQRRIKASDLNGAIIAIAATSDEKANKGVSNWAIKKNILVNVVDQPSLSNFISPAVLKKKEALIAVYTNGVSPPLSRDIKNFLNERWDEFLLFRKTKKE